MSWKVQMLTPRRPSFKNIQDLYRVIHTFGVNTIFFVCYIFVSIGRHVHVARRSHACGYEYTAICPWISSHVRQET
jgi:hypothetical protein